LIDANVELGNYDKAVKLSDKMMTIKPDIRSYSRVSYLREIHGDVSGSIDAMTMAVKAGYPGYEETAWAMLTLGDIYKQYGQLDNAEQVYSEILDMRPNYPFAVGALGEIQALRGLDKEAEATYKEAMAIIPEVGFYISLAELYKKQGRTQEMNSLIEEIMVMLQDDTDSGHNMNLEYASLYLDILNSPNKALEYAMKEYKKRPENIDVNRMLAKVSLKMDKKEDVNKYLSVAKSTNSKHPEITILEKYANS
jgi:tetratricopeptide (TPR) repeat protein